MLCGKSLLWERSLPRTQSWLKHNPRNQWNLWLKICANSCQFVAKFFSVPSALSAVNSFYPFFSWFLPENMIKYPQNWGNNSRQQPQSNYLLNLCGKVNSCLFVVNSCFEHLDFGNSDLFRISILGFRFSRLSTSSSETSINQKRAIMQNKPNLPDTKMNVIQDYTRAYENKWLCRRGENKPNQTQVQTFCWGMSCGENYCF